MANARCSSNCDVRRRYVDVRLTRLQPAGMRKQRSLPKGAPNVSGRPRVGPTNGREALESDLRLKARSLLDLSPHAFFSRTITSIAATRVPSGGAISISGSL
jgi:hypothetical protein